MLLALAAAATLLGSAAGAQGFEVDVHPGADAARSNVVFQAFDSLRRKFPGLVVPGSPRRLVLLAPSADETFVATFCWADGSLNNIPLCKNPENASSILVYPDKFDAYLAKIPDFFPPGLAMEGILFHEMMHSWGDRHPGTEYKYEHESSRGRLENFNASGTLKKFETALKKADPADAQRFNERLKAARAKAVAAHGFPQHHPLDSHSVDSFEEWYAYGGETHFYAAKPGSFLTPDERAYWAALEPVLRAP